jgi:hypothetical protein
MKQQLKTVETKEISREFHFLFELRNIRNLSTSSKSAI